MNIKPMGDRVLIETIDEQEVKQGGIIIPDMAIKRSQEGRVIAVGEGRRDSCGKLIPLSVKEGDIVILPRHGGVEVKTDGKEYKLVRDEEILSVIS